MQQKNWRIKKRALAVAILLIVAAGGYVLLPAKYHFGYQAPAALQQVTEVSYQGIDGQTALQVLEATHTVSVQHYSFGDLVQSIDGSTPDAAHAWIFYINGASAQVGASSYITKSSDVISWKIEAIQ